MSAHYERQFPVAKAPMHVLWDIYVLAGADTDGNTRWHCDYKTAARATLLAVEQLRKDYDEALDELQRLRGGANEPQ